MVKLGVPAREYSRRCFHLQLRRTLRRQVVVEVGDQVALERFVFRVAPQIVPLQRIVFQIVEFAFRAVVAHLAGDGGELRPGFFEAVRCRRRRLVAREHKTVAIDRAQVEAVAGKLAVPFAERALARAVVRCRQHLALHPLRGFDTGDGAKGRREIDLLHRLRNGRGRDVRVRRGPPDERQPHQRIDMERALVHKAEIALQLAVIGREDHIGVRIPAFRLHFRHHAADRIVDQLVHHMNLGVDLADVVVARASAA